MPQDANTDEGIEKKNIRQLIVLRKNEGVGPIFCSVTTQKDLSPPFRASLGSCGALLFFGFCRSSPPDDLAHVRLRRSVL